MENKKVLFSAVQPSGILTIGNYLGALRNFKKLQDDYNSIFSIADLHTLTVVQEQGALKKNTYELTALYIACGIDPETSILFAQSHIVPQCIGVVYQVSVFPQESTYRFLGWQKSL